MKYGRIVHIGYAKNEKSTEKRLISAGDVLECLAIQRIYESMGVKENEIVDCYVHDLENYDGEYIVVPINFYVWNIKYSRRVLPVYLGLTLGGGNPELTEREKNTLRRFQPIGCRDERTLHLMLNNGMDAYFQGCLVSTFPKREQNLPTQTVNYIVDVEAGVKDYIPEEIKKSCEFFTHDYYMTPEEMTSGEGIYKFGEDLIEMYSKNARLIITSKFHAAVIALALGIPVIMIIENYYYKYTWMSKYIPIYEPKDYPNIDWNPKPVVIPQEEKELMLKIAKKRIRETYDKYHDICTLSEIRENLGMDTFDDIFYGNYAIDYINRNWSSDTTIRYAYWGATNTAIKLEKYIKEHFKNAKLEAVFDVAIQNEFLGCMPQTPNHIEEYKGIFIFVAGNSASDAARTYFKEIQKPDSEYFLCERKVLKKEDLM